MVESSSLPRDEDRGLALLKLDEEPLGRLLASADSALARSVRRVADEAAGRSVNYAAFANTP